MSRAAQLAALLTEIRACTVCAGVLPNPPKPVLSASTRSKILIVGQAPGTKVHNTGIPWNDASGDRLRIWLGLDKKIFYDDSKISIIPMGFCYPGKGKSGDLPPRPECASLWLNKLHALMDNIELTLLIGSYAQRHYLKKLYDENYPSENQGSENQTNVSAYKFKTLTATVQNWQTLLPRYFPLPHPSPRNQLWLKRNPWFETKAVPQLKKEIRKYL